jgi:glycosyltransferase involved in cell wall biosynthesis
MSDQRLSILLSAYAFAPAEGSEAGCAWNIARVLARRHRVWVLTRGDRREAIEDSLCRSPIPGLTIVYHDLPDPLQGLRRGIVLIQFHSYLWQASILPVVRRLHRDLHFDLTHHVTYQKFWAPSFLSLVEAPFVWGPVGGADHAARGFLAGSGVKGAAFEIARTAAQHLGCLDPFVRLTARRCAIALATTPATAQRVRRLGARQVLQVPSIALPDDDLERLGGMARSLRAEGSPFTFLSVGRMLPWKGMHLGLRAFALLDDPDAFYSIVGDGMYRSHLESLARKLGIKDRVRFLGRLDRAGYFDSLRRCDAMVYPALHGAGAWAVLEAMAAGKPVIALDHGNAAVPVTPATGFMICARSEREAIDGIADAMHRLIRDAPLADRLGQAGKAVSRRQHRWENRVAAIEAAYRMVLEPRSALLPSGISG